MVLCLGQCGSSSRTSNGPLVPHLNAIYHWSLNRTLLTGDYSNKPEQSWEITSGGEQPGQVQSMGVAQRDCGPRLTAWMLQVLDRGGRLAGESAFCANFPKDKYNELLHSPRRAATAALAIAINSLWALVSAIACWRDPRQRLSSPATLVSCPLSRPCHHAVR